MNPSWRKKLLWLHTWSGLTLGLVVLLLAITGGGMVLRPVLDDVVNHDLLTVPACNVRLPLDDLAGRAVASYPGGKLHSLEVTSNPESSVLVRFLDKEQVFVDPCTGRVLGRQNQYGGYFGVLDWLHRFRFMKEGRAVAGTVTMVFLTLLVIGGLYLWWPRRGQSLIQASKFNPRLPGNARTLSLHRAVGVYTSLLLVLLCLTAIPISFEVAKQAIYDATGYTPPVKPRSAAPQADAARVPMQTQFQSLIREFPHMEWAMLRYPQKADESMEIEVRDAGLPHDNAKSYLYLDAYDGRTLRKHHYDTDTGLGRKIYLYFIALHVGLIGGLPYQLALMAAALAVPVQAYSGVMPYLRRKFKRVAGAGQQVVLTKKTRLSPDIMAFEFAHPGGSALPAFTAGAHIDVTVRKGLVRQYSLCNDPLETGRYVIGVQQHPQSRGGSTGMHEHLEVGDRVRVGMPRNHFPLAAVARHSILIAGGIGVTPMLSMAHQLTREGASFELHYCARSRERAGFTEQLMASPFAHRVHLHFSDGSVGGSLDIQGLLAKPQADTHVYVCGPVAMMDQVVAFALVQGWPEAQVHREQFAGGVLHRDDDSAFDVRLKRSGETVRIDKGRTVAEVLMARGVSIPIQCAEGVCGSCLTRVVDGQPDHRDSFLSTEERARNDCFTPCCSRARGPMLVLDL